MERVFVVGKHHLIFKLVSLSALVFVLLLNLTPATAFAASTHGSPTPKHDRPGTVHYGPYGIYCDPGWIYDNVKLQAKPLSPTTPIYSEHNGTPSNATATFTASQTGTVTLTTSIGVNVDVNAIISGVDTTLNVSVSQSISTTIGNGISITVPAYKTGNGQYGVWEEVTTGHYYYLMTTCAIGTNDGTVTAYSPWKIGWNTWISN